jgi:Excalibur calcium-binding domain
MTKRPWGLPDDDATIAAYEEHRRYREMSRRYREGRRWRRRGWIALVAVMCVGSALLWADRLELPFVRSSPEVRVWTSAKSVGPFRYCSEARAAGVAPIRRGQPGYADHLDADGDGIACEWSWRW